MNNVFRIILRAWYRFVAIDYWYEIQRSAPLVLHFPRARFMMDAFYDPGPVTDPDYEPTVVFRGYLFDTPPGEIMDVLLGKIDRGNNWLEASRGGLGTFPQLYAEYLTNKAAQISKLSTDSLDMLLWRQKVLDGPPNLSTEPTSLFWAELPSEFEKVSVDSLNWLQVPAGVHQIGLPPTQPLDLRPEAGRCVTELLEVRSQAPLGHVLFREAWRLRESNMRSALVMGIAAAETGLKEFICSAAPETSWLIENLQSPPLNKLLKHYLPALPSKAAAHQKVPPLPNQWRKTICNSVEVRNKVVHGRVVDLDRDELETMLNSVRDFLYFLDYHAGCDWVAEDAPRYK